MLRVSNLTKKFKRMINNNQKEEFLADDNISFEVNDGEIVGILGPNGAGKTTLLRMIVGILEPTSGQVEFDSKTYPKDALTIKKNLAFLSGNTKIYNSMSPYELLKMCGNFYGLPKDLIVNRIKEITSILGMDVFLHNRISKLSTGETQKVNIARCLLHDPKYYIFDEATSGLDIIASQIIIDFMKQEKARGKTILYSTHYMEEAENICDRVIMINKGKIIKIGSPAEIKTFTKTTNLRDAFLTLMEENHD